MNQVVSIGEDKELVQTFLPILHPRTFLVQVPFTDDISRRKLLLRLDRYEVSANQLAEELTGFLLPIDSIDEVTNICHLICVQRHGNLIELYKKKKIAYREAEALVGSIENLWVVSIHPSQDPFNVQSVQ